MLHKTNVPDNVHLLTLEQWEAGTVFITSFPLQSVSFSFSPLFLSLFTINKLTATVLWHSGQA